MPRHRRLSALLAPALLPLLVGCVMTREEGQQLETDLRAVEQELAVARLDQKKKEAELAERLKTTEQHMERVAKALESADATARRADADFYLKLDELIAQVQRMSGRLDEIEHRLQQLESGQPAASPTDAAAAAAVPGDTGATSAPAEALPEDKQALYDLAKQAYDAGDRERARSLFKAFLERFPDDAELSDNALYWTGEAYYQDSTYDKAILTFQKVINQYPQSNKRDASLYKIGRSFEALGLKEDAALFYEDLIAKYPSSALADDAKKRIAAAKKKSKKRHAR